MATVIKSFIVMPTGVGRPDYAAPFPLAQTAKPTVYTLSDLSELAVRLGSIVTFDRRGDVVWTDGFEDGLNKWEGMPSINAGVVSLSAEVARNGSLSAKFTGAFLADTFAGIVHYERFPVLGLVGLEASFTLIMNLSYIEFLQEFYDGTNARLFGIRYDLVNQTLNYLNSTGTYSVLATGIDIYGYLTMFHTLKFVVDLNKNEYVRCLLDDKPYPMKGISGTIAASADVPCWRVSLQSYSDIAGSLEVWMDDVILTQNEPAEVVI